MYKLDKSIEDCKIELSKKPIQSFYEISHTELSNILQQLQDKKKLLEQIHKEKEESQDTLNRIDERIKYKKESIDQAGYIIGKSRHFVCGELEVLNKLLNIEEGNK